MPKALALAGMAAAVALSLAGPAAAYAARIHDMMALFQCPRFTAILAVHGQAVRNREIDP